MLECLAHSQKKSNKYWNRAIVLSLPLLFAKNIEKYVEKSVAFITRCLKGSLASIAFSRRFIMEVELLNGISRNL